VVVVMLGVLVCLPGAAAAQTKAPRNGKPPASAVDYYSREIAIVGGGVLGLLVATGAINLVAAGTMAYEGMAIGEALEAGAGLPMPVAVLSAAIGAVLGQDFIYRTFIAGSGNGEAKPAH
jgi:hypothetical protein